MPRTKYHPVTAPVTQAAPVHTDRYGSCDDGTAGTRHVTAGHPFTELPTFRLRHRHASSGTFAPITTFINRRRGLVLGGVALFVGCVALLGVATSSSSHSHRSTHNTNIPPIPARLRGSGASGAGLSVDTPAPIVEDPDIWRPSTHPHKDEPVIDEPPVAESPKPEPSASVPTHNKRTEPQTQTQSQTAKQTPPGDVQDGHWGTDAYDWTKRTAGHYQPGNAGAGAGAGTGAWPGQTQAAPGSLVVEAPNDMDTDMDVPGPVDSEADLAHRSKRSSHHESKKKPDADDADKPGNAKNEHMGTDVFDWRKYTQGAGAGSSASPGANGQMGGWGAPTTTKVDKDKPGNAKNQHMGTDVFDWRVYTGGQAPGQQVADDKGKSKHGAHPH